MELVLVLVFLVKSYARVCIRLTKNLYIYVWNALRQLAKMRKRNENKNFSIFVATAAAAAAVCV